MKADATFRPSGVSATSAESIGAILDKLSIVQNLIALYPIDSRLALARQLLECCADRIAELADDPERAAMVRAAAPVRRRRTIWQKLDAVAFVVIVGLAMMGAAVWIVYSAGFHAGWWL